MKMKARDSADHPAFEQQPPIKERLHIIDATIVERRGMEALIASQKSEAARSKPGRKEPLRKTNHFSSPRDPIEISRKNGETGFIGHTEGSQRGKSSL